MNKNNINRDQGNTKTNENLENWAPMPTPLPLPADTERLHMYRGLNVVLVLMNLIIVISFGVMVYILNNRLITLEQRLLSPLTQQVESKAPEAIVPEVTALATAPSRTAGPNVETPSPIVNFSVRSEIAYLPDDLIAGFRGNVTLEVLDEKLGSPFQGVKIQLSSDPPVLEFKRTILETDKDGRTSTIFLIKGDGAVNIIATLLDSDGKHKTATFVVKKDIIVPRTAKVKNSIDLFIPDPSDPSKVTSIMRYFGKDTDIGFIIGFEPDLNYSWVVVTGWVIKDHCIEPKDVCPIISLNDYGLFYLDNTVPRGRSVTLNSGEYPVISTGNETVVSGTSYVQLQFFGIMPNEMIVP